MYIKDYEFNSVHNFYKKGIKRDIPDVLGVDNILVEEIADRIKNYNGEKRTSKFRGMWKIYDIDILDLLKTKVEYDRFHHYAKYNKDINIRPFEMLARCIKTKYYMYKGKRLISYFNSDKNKYMRALKRIRLGWSIEETIDRQDEIIPYKEAGAKGFQIMCDNKGISRKEGVKIIHSIIR